MTIFFKTLYIFKTLSLSFCLYYSYYALGYALGVDTFKAMAASQVVIGSETGLSLPRFVSLNQRRANHVNVRAGPSFQYPIKWIFQRNRLPVKVVAEYGDWRRIIDMDNEQGWIHKSLLSLKRTAMIQGDLRVLYGEADKASIPKFMAEPGVVGWIIKCDQKWCFLDVNRQKGWVQQEFIWGTFSQEIIE